MWKYKKLGELEKFDKENSWLETCSYSKHNEMWNIIVLGLWKKFDKLSGLATKLGFQKELGL